MSIVKVIEVIASSEKSIEDALQQAVTEASKTIRNIDSVYVKDIKAHVSDGKISSYGLICKISFRLDEGSATGEKSTDAAAETPSKENEGSQQQTNGDAKPVAKTEPVIQGKPGKETERGRSKAASGEKPKAESKEETSDKGTGAEQTPHEVATDTSQYKPDNASQKEPEASSENESGDTSSKEPDDRVENEEEVSDPENQKDFIPGH